MSTRSANVWPFVLALILFCSTNGVALGPILSHAVDSLLYRLSADSSFGSSHAATAETLRLLARNSPDALRITRYVERKLAEAPSGSYDRRGAMCMEKVPIYFPHPSRACISEGVWKVDGHLLTGVWSRGVGTLRYLLSLAGP